MTTTGIFSTRAYTVEVKNKPVFLHFFGDIHRDAPLHANDAWQEYMDDTKQRLRAGENCIFIGMGDYVDGVSSSERSKFAASDFHESTQKRLERMWEEDVALLGKELAFMKGRLIGLLEGNHYASFPDGTTSSQRLCHALDTQYLGVSSFIRLTLRDSGGRSITFDIWAHHGKGAARLTGGSLNRVEQMAEAAVADCFCMGHDHRRMSVPGVPKLYLSYNHRDGTMTVKQKQIWLVRSGSFLRAYVEGEASYIADAARSPCSLGHAELKLALKRNRDGGANTVYLDVRPNA